MAPLPKVRNTYTGVIAAMAECHDCGWQSEARNAMGNGNQHARRTGHHVTCEQVVSVAWNKRED